VGAVAVIALLTTAAHAVATGGSLDSAHAVASARQSDGYYACLTAQAHSLLRPGDVAYMGDHPTLNQWVTITKVIGGWARVTLDRDRSTVAIGLGRFPSRHTCAGYALVTARRARDGRVVLSRGMQSSP